MNRPSPMCRVQRAKRHRDMVDAYQRGLSSREVAAAFGMSSSMVRHVVQLYGVARRRGRPAK